VLQSGSALLTAGMVVNALMLQADPGAAQVELALGAVGGRAFLHGRAAAADVEAATVERLHDGVGAVRRGAARAAGGAVGEVEDRRRSGRRGRRAGGGGGRGRRGREDLVVHVEGEGIGLGPEGRAVTRSQAVVGLLASSFAKQPFVGSTPPVYLSCTFWIHAGSTARFLPSAL
jgi:hypothetical protein